MLQRIVVLTALTLGSALPAAAQVDSSPKAAHSGGLETLVLVQDGTGAWNIRHSHTSARRRAPAAVGGAQR